MTSTQNSAEFDNMAESDPAVGGAEINPSVMSPDNEVLVSCEH